VGGTYHWTDGIGPPENRPTGISGFTGAPATNEYGFDEQMLFMEQLGATTNVVVNFGAGTEQEAAAFVAYANGDAADPTPLGTDAMGVDWGTVGDWAAQREANQARLGMTPHVYGIEYWEVGSELYGEWEYSWTHDPVKYAFGGTAWQQDEPVVTADDWREEASCSTGTASQVFYVRYPPVVEGTQTISVGEVVWTEVADLSSAGPNDTVYEFDDQTGEIRFGDWVNGLIPQAGAQIQATYESGPHGGYVDYYAAMKSVDPDIRVGSCHFSDEFLLTMGEEHPYDFLIVHPYSSSGDLNGGGLEEAHLRTMVGPLDRQIGLEELRASVQFAAGSQASQVELAITEYNLFVPEESTPTPHYGMSLDQGLFLADMVRVLVEEGIALGNLHCLISTGTGEGWGNTPVTSAYPELLPRPGAYVLELYNQHFAEHLVESGVEGAPLLSGSVPTLEVLSSRDDTGRLTLLVINKHATAAIETRVSLNGFAPQAAATVWTLSGLDITAYNDTAHPNDVTLTESLFTEAGETFVYAFPPHSVTVMELHGGWRVYLPVVTRDPIP
jgi:alpha-N-arabinofuranosidase